MTAPRWRSLGLSIEVPGEPASSDVGSRTAYPSKFCSKFGTLKCGGQSIGPQDRTEMQFGSVDDGSRYRRSRDAFARSGTDRVQATARPVALNKRAGSYPANLGRGTSRECETVSTVIASQLRADPLARNDAERPKRTGSPSLLSCEWSIAFCGAAKLSRGPLLTGNGNSAGLSVLVQLACKLRSPRSSAPRK